ncbi:hypothetical protein CDCA_CDCA11G3172 [Cyanidium caldarium]|uniref:Deoxycytidylate deaminase n=1 Tax=Cyanidium caldarium TaxID=2771 RepID=A0AAV9IXY1_CYACA|nr:hypothetical protein CDCA_CDCA11G3172 [Cyanidium caldarium]|eukprot:ctg_2637.g466
MLIGVTGRVCAGKRTVSGLVRELYGCVEIPAGDGIDGSVDGVGADGGTTLPFPDDAWVSGRHYVLSPIDSVPLVEALRKRPYFLLLAVEAPLLMRYRRYRRRQHAAEDTASLEAFVRLDDASYYGTSSDTADSPPVTFGAPSTTLRRCVAAADVRLVNADESIEALAQQIARLDLLNAERLRPSWDAYFMRMANLASMRTNCMKRRVGAVIVRDHRVVATGYNGTPRGTRNCNAGGCPRCNDDARAGHALDECLCLHAEENALIEAGRARCADATLYTNLCPCLGCTKKIVQAGVRQVVYGMDYAMDERSAALLTEAGVRIRRFAQSPSADADAACADAVPHVMDDHLLSPCTKFTAM